MGLARLAPIAFVAGVVLFGLSIITFTFSATAPGYGPADEHEGVLIGETAVLAYPVPVSAHSSTRIDVLFEFPQHPGTAMIVGCNGYSALLQGDAPGEVRASTFGVKGGLSSIFTPEAFGEADDPSFHCPFRYVVFQWDLRDDAASANTPDATVETSPVLATSVMLGLAGATAVLGLLLAFIGGTAWARGLHETPTGRAGDDESTSETLLLLIEKTGPWLDRTRRHLVAAGVLGIFLWYPVVLPWAWQTAMRGSPGALYPWVLSVGVVALLLTLTVVWVRAYLRLDQELMAWRKRMDRLRRREAQLLAELDLEG